MDANTSMSRPLAEPCPPPLRSLGATRVPTGPESLQDVLRFLGEEPAGSWMLPAAAFPMRRLRREQFLVVEGAQPEALYVVRFGTFKSLRVAEDGYEQVFGFSGPAEVIGFEGLAMGWHPASVVALEDAAVHALPVGMLEDLRHDVPALDHALQRALGRQLARRADLADLMAAVAAEVRLARFLVQSSARAAEVGRSPRRLRLAMSRRDIASYLGVAHETVSRAFGALAHAGYVQVNNRDVDVLDMHGLEACARVTRGPGPTAMARGIVHH